MINKISWVDMFLRSIVLSKRKHGNFQYNFEMNPHISSIYFVLRWSEVSTTLASTSAIGQIFFIRFSTVSSGHWLMGSSDVSVSSFSVSLRCASFLSLFAVVAFPKQEIEKRWMYVDRSICQLTLSWTHSFSPYRKINNFRWISAKVMYELSFKDRTS